MPKYYNEITREIVDYPEEAAALFPVLKPVPSEKSRTQDIEADESGTEFVIDIIKTPAKKNDGEVNAK